jgi:hypothetical protein
MHGSSFSQGLYKLGNMSSEILSGPMRVFFSEVLKQIDVHRSGTTGGVGGVTPQRKVKRGPNVPRGGPGMLELRTANIFRKFFCFLVDHILDNKINLCINN